MGKVHDICCCLSARLFLQDKCIGSGVRVARRSGFFRDQFYARISDVFHETVIQSCSAVSPCGIQYLSDIVLILQLMAHILAFECDDAVLHRCRLRQIECSHFRVVTRVSRVVPDRNIISDVTDRFRYIILPVS